MKRALRWPAIAAVTALTCGMTAGASQAAERVAAAPAASPGTCTPVPVVSRSLVSASGRSLNTANARQAAMQDLVYKVPQGGAIQVEVPLPGFSAATAATAELSGLGLRSAAMRPLLRLISAPGMRYVSVSSLCRLTGLSYGSAAANPDDSVNWAGPVVNAKGAHRHFYEAAASFAEPRFEAGCRGKSDHAIWTGLGGYAGSADLIQDGTDTEAGARGDSHAFAWFELIGARAVYPAIELSTKEFPVDAGNKMTVLAYYKNDKIVFYYVNSATKLWARVTISEAFGHRPSYFYDGASAEVINERGFTGRVFLQYKEPAGKRATFSAASFNGGQTARADKRYLHVLTMTRDGANGGPVLDRVGGLKSTRRSSSWHDQWYRCN
jgi:hypothetical protein